MNNLNFEFLLQYRLQIYYLKVIEKVTSIYKNSENFEIIRFMQNSKNLTLNC